MWGCGQDRRESACPRRGDVDTCVDTHIIASLRDAGLGWHEIGARLGTTSEAVRSAYRRSAHRGDPPPNLPDAPAVPASHTSRGAGGASVAAVLPTGGPDRPGDTAGALSLKSEIELRRASLARITRAEIRMKYSLLADEEINRVLAERLHEFDQALQNGILPSVGLKLVDE